MSTSGRGQVLIPWPNRILDGSYEFDGQRHQLAIDDATEQDAIHGLVRWAAWTVAEREPDRVVMEHMLHPQPGYPFSLALAIEYLLSDRGAAGADDRHERRDERRARTGAARIRTSPSGPDAWTRWSCARPGGRCCGRTSAASRSAPSPSRAPTTTSAGRGRSARPGSTTPSPTSSATTTASRASSCAIPSGGRGLTLWVDESYPYLMLFTATRCPTSTGAASRWSP